MPDDFRCQVPFDSSGAFATWRLDGFVQSCRWWSVVWFCACGVFLTHQAVAGDLLLGQFIGSRTALSGNYESFHSDGSQNVRFVDPFEARVGQDPRFLQLDFQLTERVDVAVELLKAEGGNQGQIAKKVHFGPFRFFVSAPTESRYSIDIARFWLGRRQVLGDTELSLRVGLIAVYEKLSASAVGVGHKSVAGVLPLPAAGIAVQKEGILGTRWMLAADYGHIEVGRVWGSVVSLRGSVEKPVTEDFSLGIGYRHDTLHVSGERTRFEARLNQRITGPFAFVRKTF